jgi:hypothetical protein
MGGIGGGVAYNLGIGSGIQRKVSRVTMFLGQYFGQHRDTLKRSQKEVIELSLSSSFLD